MPLYQISKVINEQALRYFLTVENAPDRPYEFTIDDIDGDGLVDIQKLRQFSTIESCLVNESFVYSWDGLVMREQRTLVASPNSVECYNLIPTPTAIPTFMPTIIASSSPYDPDKPWSEQIEFEGFRLLLYSAVARLEERLQPGTDFEQLRELIQHVIGQIPTDTQVRDVVISRLLFMIANSYELEGNEPMAVAQYLALVQQYPESLWSQLAQARLEPVDG